MQEKKENKSRDELNACSAKRDRRNGNMTSYPVDNRTIRELGRWNWVGGCSGDTKIRM